MSDWKGRSGRHYRLAVEPLESFVMREHALYVVAADSHVLWVGSAIDLVSEPASRARFRHAVAAANLALRLDGSSDSSATIWDLEGATPATVPAAQAA